MDRIRVDGFPRSGNTYLSLILKDSFPKIDIEPFGHNAKTITSNHFILIREPNIAISSFMNTFQEKNFNSSENWWIRFYNTALEISDISNWIFFNDLISDTFNIISKIGKSINTVPIKLNYLEYDTNSSSTKYSLYSFEKANNLYYEFLSIKQNLHINK